MRASGRGMVVAALLLVSLCAVAPARAGGVSGSGFNVVGAVWGSPSIPVEAGSGSQDVQLTVTTQYYFQNTATSMVATLSLPQGFTDLNGGSSPSSYVSGPVPSGTVVPFVFYLDISPATPVGAYNFPITFSWGAQTGLTSTTVTQTSNVQVHMDGKVKLIFSAEPASLTAGALNEVNVTLTNNGSGPATQITTTVSPSQLLSVVNTFPDFASLGVNSSATRSLEVYAPSTSAGTPVTLSFTATYNDAYGTPRSVTQAVGFFVSPLPTTSPVGISLSALTLQAGRVNNFTVTLSNQGTSPIAGLSATFSFVGGQVTWLSPDIIQTPILKPGSSLTVQARAYDPATSAGSATLQGVLRYSYNNVTVQESRSVGLLSRGLIDIVLTGATVLPQAVDPGQIVSITLTITNVGVISASAVTAQARMPQGFQAIGSSSNFVGDMVVDSPSTFTFSALVANATAPGTYQVPVTMSYFDNLRTPLMQTVNVSVYVVSGGGSGGGSTQTTAQSGRGGGLSAAIYVVIIVVALAIVALYIRRRRSSRMPSR